jgi:MFS family permease
MAMIAWLIIGASVGWLLGIRRDAPLRLQTVMAMGGGVIGGVVGGLVAGFVAEGQFDLEWQPSGIVGAALGVAVIPVDNPTVASALISGRAGPAALTWPRHPAPPRVGSRWPRRDRQ